MGKDKGNSKDSKRKGNNKKGATGKKDTGKGKGKK